MTPPVKGLACTAWVILCALPLYFLQAELHAGLLPLTMTVAFSLASMWLLAALALGAVAGMVWCAAVMIIAVLSRGHLSADDVALVCLASAGMIGLAALALAIKHRRIEPVLQGDLEARAGRP